MAKYAIVDATTGKVVETREFESFRAANKYALTLGRKYYAKRENAVPLRERKEE